MTRFFSDSTEHFPKWFQFSEIETFMFYFYLSAFSEIGDAWCCGFHIVTTHFSIDGAYIYINAGQV